MSAKTLLTKLRAELARHGFSALVVPSADPHNSEYVGAPFKRRERICGFSGSAGTAVVTADDALLWTDGRYWIEAEMTLFPEWKLMKEKRGDPSHLTLEQWLERTLPSGSKVALDPMCFTVNAWERFVSTAPKLQFVENFPNIVDVVSEVDPAVADAVPNSIFPLKLEFSGKSLEEKIAAVASEISAKKCSVAIFSALDDVAWLYNLRSTSDMEYNPVFYSFAAVESSGKAFLFVHEKKLTKEALESLEKANVKIYPYTCVQNYFLDLVASSKEKVIVAIDKSQTSQGLLKLITETGAITKPEKGFIQFMKAIKNETEIAGFKACHVRDGAALTKYLAWLDREVKQAKSIEEAPTEISAADKLESFRRQDPKFVQLSFTTISSTGPNGAIIHYHPNRNKAHFPIRRDALYLCDSGAQYLDGTTDVTRTVCFDFPRPEEVEAYTLVLKGNLALHDVKFPKNIAGTRLDCLARTALWSVGLDYGHGTSHGVGSFLCVHEGPQGIGVAPAAAGGVLERGMVVSNEPGFYKPDHFGIRIENLEVIVACETKHNTGEFSTFQWLTCAPLCRDLIDATLLSEREIQLIDNYHAWVSRMLIPLAEKDHVAVEYIKKHCAPFAAS